MCPRLHREGAYFLLATCADTYDSTFGRVRCVLGPFGGGGGAANPQGSYGLLVNCLDADY